MKVVPDNQIILTLYVFQRLKGPTIVIINIVINTYLLICVEGRDVDGVKHVKCLA